MLPEGFPFHQFISKGALEPGARREPEPSWKSLKKNSPLQLIPGNMFSM